MLHMAEPMTAKLAEPEGRVLGSALGDPTQLSPVDPALCSHWGGNCWGDSWLKGFMHASLLGVNHATTG